MGLDAVELILEVEETFGIKIEDDAAGKMLTIGQMFNYICYKVKTDSPRTYTLNMEHFKPLTKKRYLACSG